MSVGSMLATLNFCPQMMFTPTQKIIIERSRWHADSEGAP